MTKRILTTSAVTALLVFCSALPVNAQLEQSYNADHPLIIAYDWDMPPYEFNNNRGEPDGYDVQLLSTILQRLKIKYKMIMTEAEQVRRTFERREADLIIDPTYRYRGRPYIISRNAIDFYHVKVAMRKGDKRLFKIAQLTENDTLLLKSDDYAAKRIVEERDIRTPYEYLSPREALTNIAQKRHDYFIWGEAQLKWNIRELALNDIVLDEIDIPDGEIHIVGYDKELLDAIDDEYARMEQSGDLSKIYDKWFHPELVHNDTSPVALIILIGIIIATVIILLLSQLIRSRVKAAVHRSKEINQMMAQALNMGNFYVTEYDVNTTSIRNIFGSLLPSGGLTLDKFIERIHTTEREQFRQNIKKMISGDISQQAVKTTWKDADKWLHLQGHAIAESEGGRVRYIVLAVKDVSKEIEEERENREMGFKYMKMFDTNLVAMSFYDKDGMLIDVNDNMRHLCEFDEEGEKYFRQTRLFDAPLIKDQFDPSGHDNFHVCQKMHYPDIGIDKYIEFRITPTFDSNDELRYYVVTARDLSAERIMYMDQRKHDQEIQKTNEVISEYENQLNYLLENSQMFIWNYYLEDNIIRFSRNARNLEYTETLEDFFEGVEDNVRQAVLDEVHACVAAGIPYNATHYYKYTPVEKRPVWYAISGVPTYDKDGKIVKYFGISRNITKLMDAQQKLKRETARAEDSGKMKSAFLANMTHEIRTPLNAIVGFSDLLPLVDTAEERMEFIRIIRNNCDMLMRLINDILEASNMGQALAIEPAEVDFAQVFDDICQTLAQRVQEPGVEFVKDNPYDHYRTTLDKGRVQQVLTNFTTNAVKYTHQGHIKVGYHHERRITKDGNGESDGLYFYCEDTGAGIPKEKQASVFERFVKLNDYVQGTGLGLSICQAIADRCNGHIGVTSEGEGHGSTFWMWIPCEHREK